MFKRDILFHLERWKDDTHRKPLILRGARQVGKTTVVNEFGKQFDNYLYLNLEKREAASLFELNVSLKDLMPLFFAHCGKIRNEGTILLFIDEIHRLAKPVEEVLYSAMEDYYIDIVIGEGQTTHAVHVPLPPFTLIGATTLAGQLSAPLRDRFGIVEHMQYYTVDELEKIVQR